MKLNFIFNYETEMLKLTVSKEKKIYKSQGAYFDIVDNYHFGIFVYVFIYILYIQINTQIYVYIY